MAQHRTLLVVGENHKEIAAKYSRTSCGEKEELVLLDKAQAAQALQRNIDFQRARLEYNGQMVKVDEETGRFVPVTDEKDYFKVIKEEDGAEVKEQQAFLLKIDEESERKNLARLESFTPETYFQACVKNSLKRGCQLIDDKIVAYKFNNPLGRYDYERCALDDTEETFINPFILLDGTEKCVAKKGDIDWSLINMCKADVEDADIIWSTCREGRTPTNERETKLYEAMKNRSAYLNHFDSKEDFINHCCAFWCYGVATDDYCCLAEDNDSENEWIRNFFSDFIEQLSDDTTLSLYEITI